MSVIQFNSAVYLLKELLTKEGYINLTIPQEKPRCGGEVKLLDSRLHFASTWVFTWKGHCDLPRWWKIPHGRSHDRQPQAHLLQIQSVWAGEIIRHLASRSMISTKWWSLGKSRYSRTLFVRSSALEWFSECSGVRAALTFSRFSYQRIEDKCKDLDINFTVILISEIFPQQLKLFGE